MDLDKDNYHKNLKQILEHLLHADFVALDFEFSGIKTKPARTVIEQMAEGRPVPDGKPSLQERYNEIREVAEKYTIFQVGITIAQQDTATNGYVLRPYNMHMNPLVIHKMDIDRDVTILSSAATFLQRNRFDLNKPFVEGVPYLSRDEHRRAVQLESERLDGLNAIDLDFEVLEEPLVNFVNDVRGKISRWKPYNKSASLTINSPRGRGLPLEMIQRRVVHQLVRREFKNLIATTHANGMKIIQFDAEQELHHKRVKMDTFFARLSKQVGIRWIFEALMGGNLSDLRVADLYIDPEDVTWIDLTKAKAEFAVIREGLAKRRPVIVGHNPFTDLIYFHRLFIGTLPERVGDFAKAIHRLFPLVVDTKYLATHHGLMEASSLQELSQECSDQRSPNLIIPEEYAKYQYHAAAHEAGYDSLATAKVVIRSSARLAVRTMWRQAIPSPKRNNIKVVERSQRPGKFARRDDLLIDFSDDSDVGGDLKKLTLKPRTLREISYQHHAIFTPLDISNSRIADSEISMDPKELLPSSIDLVNSNPNTWRLTPEQLPVWMPSWCSDFWLVYGNKIRVNGTEEGILNLGPE